MRPRDIPRNAVLGGRNLIRSLRRAGLDWVLVPVGGSYPEWPAPRPALPFPLGYFVPFVPETSLEDMRRAAKVIEADPRVRGVVLRFGALGAGLATLHSLRQILLGLRAKGKRCVAWLPSAGVAEYYLASACDEVIMPPAGQLSALGLRAEALFLKDTLALAGVEADLEAIAEYKVSPDMFRRSAMTEPHREMLAAVLDSHFDELTSAIAEGRRLAPAAVRELIDAMPMDAARAAEASLVDAVLYEDELATHLGTPGEKPGDGVIAAPLVTWREAIRWLRRPLRRTTRQVIGVVALEGMIVTGHSRRVPAPLPIPFLEATAGAETIAQALRRAEADRRVAAVIFYVETPGGSALASDLIAREIRRLRQRKPVVVLMGGQATSGGYYVSALANHIVARPTTLTGSIGIWGGKFVLRGLYAKLGVGSEAVQRGAMAGLYAEAAPFSEEERARIRRDLGESYARFRRLVAEGRGMTEERVEEIARGRVWSGAQALEIGLVDQLGDYETALAKAKELAGLDPQRECTVVPIRAGRQALLPPPFAAAGAGWQELSTILRELAQERAWALAPWIVRVGG